MINVKDEVYAALLAVTDNVTDCYPKDWEKDLSIQYMEEDNKVVEYTDMREQKAYIRYRIDIWHRKSTTAAAVAVDAAIEKLGLLRTGCQDVDDPSGRKHKQMRYEMVIDVNTKRGLSRHIRKENWMLANGAKLGYKKSGGSTFTDLPGLKRNPGNGY